MPSPIRREKLSMVFREELSKIVDREMDFPEGNLVTITKIIISDDGYYARALLSILGNNPAETLDILKKNIYHIQQALNRKVRVRPVPKITFVLDHEEFKREAVERALAKIKRGKELS